MPLRAPQHACTQDGGVCSITGHAGHGEGVHTHIDAHSGYQTENTPEYTHVSVLGLFLAVQRLKAADFLEISSEGFLHQKNGALHGTQKGNILSARDRPELCPDRSQGEVTRWRDTLGVFWVLEIEDG